MLALNHLRFAQPRALDRKVGDEYTVLVCRLHHCDLHRYGDEASWWVGVTSIRCPWRLSYGGDRNRAQFHDLYSRGTVPHLFTE